MSGYLQTEIRKLYLVRLGQRLSEAELGAV